MAQIIYEINNTTDYDQNVKILDLSTTDMFKIELPQKYTHKVDFEHILNWKVDHLGKLYDHSKNIYRV